MSVNPEFRKNLWMEFSPTRLVVLPLLLGAVFYLTWLTDDKVFGTGTRSVSMGLFVGFCFIWGTYQAGESVGREIRERTWDWMRLSAVRPWPLAWGKLFGSAAYAWLGGILCLPVYILSSLRDPSWDPRTLSLLVTGALACQGIGMFLALQPQSLDGGTNRSRSAAGLVFAFFFVSPILSSLRAEGLVTWYGAVVPAKEFTTATLALVFGWTLVGIHGRLRDEFRMRTLPWAWCAFVLFLMMFAAGFAADGDGAPPLAVAFLMSAVLAYVAIFFERKDPVALRRLVTAGRSGQWRRVAEGTPCFVLVLPFVIASAAALVADPGTMASKGGGGAAARGVVLAAVAFLLRDLSLVLYLNMGGSPKRADLFSVLCLGVLYGLVPGILGALGAGAATAIFWPLPNRWMLSLGGAFVQAVVMGWMAVRRWMGRGG